MRNSVPLNFTFCRSSNVSSGMPFDRSTIVGNIVIDDVRDALHIETTRGNVGCDQNVDSAPFQPGDRALALSLLNVAVQGGGGKAARGKGLTGGLWGRWKARQGVRAWVRGKPSAEGGCVRALGRRSGLGRRPGGGGAAKQSGPCAARTVRRGGLGQGSWSAPRTALPRERGAAVPERPRCASSRKDRLNYLSPESAVSRSACGVSQGEDTGGRRVT